MLAAQVFLPRSGTLLHAGGIGLGLGLTSRCMQTLGATPKAACTLGRGTDHPIAQHDNVPTADPLAWVRFPVVVNYADVLGGAERHQRVGQLEGGGPASRDGCSRPTSVERGVWVSIAAAGQVVPTGHDRAIPGSELIAALTTSRRSPGWCPVPETGGCRVLWREWPCCLLLCGECMSVPGRVTACALWTRDFLAARDSDCLWTR